MKTMLKRTGVTVGVALGLFCASLAFGGQPAAAQNDKSFSGTISAVNRKDKSVSVKDFWSTKIFNAADNCKVSCEDQPDASLAELHPGQKVEIAYQDSHGVLVAHQIAQHNVVFTGYITAIDPASRTLAVKHGAFARNFAITENCPVVIKDDKTGALGDLEIGQTVHVVYETQNGILLARKIEQKNPTFVGAIRSIDAETRTVKAKNLLSEKTFHLADGCRIVVDSNPNASLKDLRIGDRIAFNYEDTDGVLVANRLGRGAASPEADMAQTSKSAAATP